MATGVRSSSLVVGPSSADGWVLRRSDPFAALGLDDLSALAAIRCDRRAAKIALTGNSARKKNTVTAVSISENSLMVSPLLPSHAVYDGSDDNRPYHEHGRQCVRHTIP
jgi:hypothetical protein